MREYLTRAVNKARGVHTATRVMPNHPPVFPPAEPETAFANPDARGRVAFRFSVRDAGYPPAPPSIVHALGLPGAPQEVSYQADGSPIALAADGLEVPPDRVSYEAAPFARFMSRRADQISPTVEIAPRPVDLRLSRPKTVVGDEKSATRAWPWVAEPVVADEIEPPGSDRRRELLDEIQISRRESAVPGDTHAATEETVVQVHIGRVEVRTAAPVTGSAPSPARAKGPRGFAEYESMRRYTSRNRF